MILDILSKQNHREFKENGVEILRITYKGHFYFGDMSYGIYHMNGEFAICSEEMVGYGPVYKLMDALKWEGLKYTIEDFEFSSQVLTPETLKSLKYGFLSRMNDMAFIKPKLISKLDTEAFWKVIDLHVKNDSGIDCKDLKSFLIPRSIYGEVFLDSIILLTVEKNYLKILYKYGIDTIQLLMGYFLKKEDYLICKEIHEMVINHNEQTGNNLCSIKN